jgi:carbon monoxide dehydrogenase subunit G
MGGQHHVGAIHHRRRAPSRCRVSRGRSPVGVPIKTEWEFVAYDPPQRFIVHSDSLTIETTCTYTFTETDVGTRVRWQYDSELHGVFKAAAPLLPGVLLRLHQRQFRVAKEILEAAA